MRPRLVAARLTALLVRLYVCVEMSARLSLSLQVARRDLPRVRRCLSLSTRPCGSSLARRSLQRNQRQIPSSTRSYSSTSLLSHSQSFESTPLGKNGQALLQGLEVYSVPAADGHPLAVYGIASSADTSEARRPILLLHGRTWSSVPVYHLMGGSNATSTTDKASRSMMEALLARGLEPYAMDFRGFGGTPTDKSGCVEPLQCVNDAEIVLEWIHNRHGETPALLGWSQGALVAQLLAQKPRPPISKLVLYGSIYDPLVRYPREPLYQTRKANLTRTLNTIDDAIEDFTIEGSIPP
jgi:Serine aminopeptidase, S33